MSVDRVSTSAQTAFLLNQIQNAGNQLDKVQEQIASGKNANTYAGFGDKAQVLTATISANARNTAYTDATKFAVIQTDLQDTQLTGLSSLVTSLKKAVSDAVANNDATTLMNQAQSIFDQVSAILNSKDANGDYIYSGGKTDVPPVSVSSLSGLTAIPSAANAFANGNLQKSVQVADGVTVSYGITASDVATGLMQPEGHRRFRCQRRGNFNAATSLTSAQKLSDQHHRPGHHGHSDLNAHRRQWLCLQPSHRRPDPAGLDGHALQAVHLRHPGHQHGPGRHQPSLTRPSCRRRCRSQPGCTSFRC
jgi:flagellin-like hook-associated protein FlgL